MPADRGVQLRARLHALARVDRCSYGLSATRTASEIIDRREAQRKNPNVKHQQQQQCDPEAKRQCEGIEEPDVRAQFSPMRCPPPEKENRSDRIGGPDDQKVECREKEPVVAVTYTRVHPDAVMIHVQDAAAANGAVVCARWSPPTTSSADSPGAVWCGSTSRAASLLCVDDGDVDVGIKCCHLNSFGERRRSGVRGHRFRVRIHDAVEEVECYDEMNEECRLRPT